MVDTTAEESVHASPILSFTQILLVAAMTLATVTTSASDHRSGVASAQALANGVGVFGIFRSATPTPGTRSS